VAKSISLSEQIKQHILADRRSRYELAQISGVAESTLSRFVHGERAISQDAMNRIGKVLRLKVIRTEKK